MYLAVVVLFLFILFWIVALSVAGGKLALSKDKPESKPYIPAEKEKNKVQNTTVVTTNTKPTKPFIELPNGMTIELEPHEVTKAKKDGYKIIFK